MFESETNQLLCQPVMLTGMMLVERGLVLDTNPEISNVFSVDDEDRMTIGDFDEMICLIRNQHSPVNRDIGNTADGGGNAGEDDCEVSFTVKFAKRLAELSRCHRRVS